MERADKYWAWRKRAYERASKPWTLEWVRARKVRGDENRNMETRNSLLFLHLICLHIYICSATSFGEKYGLFAKYRVHIVNRIDKARRPLVVRCQSGDDDLGVHKLGLNKEFSWAFKVNWSGSTLYFCRFTLGRRTTSFDVFNVFVEGDWCGKWSYDIYWVARNDGFYLGCHPGWPTGYLKSYSW
ncbi:hypothetical protein HS088_TW19G00875 [Tripterygium wilfordii]|uniref:S-protein homolog n=1 Tax=Tripterygium wilfordii TaxID=458696 RepID=A0A7J7CAX5_TRIWF|nr:hypothetical protein HS088_TW19G00875 [Tripterygium wilfordii]